ncbi:hypothetical protein OESDEN_00838 [Oesophagostomum dentatum]|uniref:CC domain-containing protein n=1 Tax=Oesophagostomum dentatum TaxID=61180 RepID=A0A0B1TSW1_OESDE|nr:hypothetical protein OESDEN_00838 [Oesophagostomum dentatum]
MQQIIALVFLFTGTLAIRQPTCPNDLLPKLDKNGRPLQCIPGSSSRLVCGEGYSCFFSGMNYMCCPTNEPPSSNQLACPAHSLTVLDPSGLPLKCDTWTHACPQVSTGKQRYTTVLDVFYR